MARALALVAVRTAVGANAVPMGAPKHGSGYKEALKLKAAARFKEISHAQARQHQ